MGIWFYVKLLVGHRLLWDWDTLLELPPPEICVQSYSKAMEREAITVMVAVRIGRRTPVATARLAETCIYGSGTCCSVREKTFEH